MNYLIEINSFYGWIAYNPLPIQAQALWHLLMHINNRCTLRTSQNTRLWRVHFTVANSVINNTLGFTNKMQLQRAREELINAKRIEYTCGTKTQCGTYKIIPFDVRMREGEVDGEKVWITSLIGNDECKSVTDSVTNPVTNPVTDTVTDTLPFSLQTCDHYININNKQKKLDSSSGCMYESMYDARTEKKLFTVEIQKLMMECWGCKPTKQDYEKAQELITRYDREKRTTYLDNDAFGLLAYAFKESAYYKVCNWRYIDGILQRLRSLGITTADEAERDDICRDIEREGKV